MMNTKATSTESITKMSSTTSVTENGQKVHHNKQDNTTINNFYIIPKLSLRVSLVLILIFIVSSTTTIFTSQSHLDSFMSKIGSMDYDNINNSNFDGSSSSKTMMERPLSYGGDTAVIILSSLVPTHPSLDMLNETIMSLTMLDGLILEHTPIYIMVDRMVTPKVSTDETIANEKRLEEYIKALYHAYEDIPNYHIIVSAYNQHIGGSVGKAIDLILKSNEDIRLRRDRQRNYDNNTSTSGNNEKNSITTSSRTKTIPNVEEQEIKFVYNVQHDFKFARTINHTAIIKSMLEYPNVFHMIRFNKQSRVTNSGCQPKSAPTTNQDSSNNDTKTNHSNNTSSSLSNSTSSSNTNKTICLPTTAVCKVNDIYLTKTHYWSDNNHISSLPYYKKLLDMVSHLQRPLEFPMMVASGKDCEVWGQHVYGKPRGEAPALEHLDGRLGYHLKHPSSS